VENDSLQEVGEEEEEEEESTLVMAGFTMCSIITMVGLFVGYVVMIKF